MSSPTSHSIGVKSVGTAGIDQSTAALIAGTKWDDGGGPAVALTYSFPSGTAYFKNGYGDYAFTSKDGFSGDGEFHSFYALTTTEKAGIAAALGAWAAVANVTFTEVAESSTVVGELRFAVTDVASKNESAHAYFPSYDPVGGDVWFKNGEWHTSPGSNLRKGSYDYLTAIHEIGHALGLKHPHQGSPKLSAAKDNYSYTVMSYKAHKGGDNYADYYPTTPMWFDILAMQKLYGKASHNPGDTTYTYHSNQQYWETICDTGGNDTIVSVGKADVSINLAIGHWNKLGRKIDFGDGSTRAKAVMIGPDTDIENATGGKGDDLIKGNGLGNTLKGSDGRDVLKGKNGNDKLFGGDDSDKLNGGKGQDQYVFKEKPGNGVDTITKFQSGETIALDKNAFSGIGDEGPLASKYFTMGAKAKDADDHIIYKRGSGDIFHDADGSGKAGKELFAHVKPGTSLHADDFMVI
ncbi:MAG: M10 family metallopeptidase [Bauldia sp.]|uniref:M10 family metallopeptidase n=1 Tax=Bauldia sp. TaxID=2575872 RepID=UPI001DAF20DC|nr:M10 family metallopeptidase [Bauldia sp.]MCB1494905.1 M10 family metallopeptidase [Bauldia sp.]